MHNNDASTCNAHPAHKSIPSNIKSKPVPRPPTRQRHAPIAPRRASRALAHALVAAATPRLRRRRPQSPARRSTTTPASPHAAAPSLGCRPRTACARAAPSTPANTPTPRAHRPRRASRALAHALVAAATPCVCVRV